MTIAPCRWNQGRKGKLVLRCDEGIKQLRVGAVGILPRNRQPLHLLNNRLQARLSHGWAFFAQGFSNIVADQGN